MLCGGAGNNNPSPLNKLPIHCGHLFGTHHCHPFNEDCKIVLLACSVHCYNRLLLLSNHHFMNYPKSIFLLVALRTDAHPCLVWSSFHVKGVQRGEEEKNHTVVTKSSDDEAFMLNCMHIRTKLLLQITPFVILPCIPHQHLQRENINNILRTRFQ